MLTLRLYEHINSDEFTCIGKVSVSISQLSISNGQTKSFPLEPPENLPTTNLQSNSRFLLLYKSSILVNIHFSRNPPGSDSLSESLQSFSSTQTIPHLRPTASYYVTTVNMDSQPSQQISQPIPTNSSSVIISSSDNSSDIYSNNYLNNNDHHSSKLPPPLPPRVHRDIPLHPTPSQPAHDEHMLDEKYSSPFEIYSQVVSESYDKPEPRNDDLLHQNPSSPFFSANQTPAPVKPKGPGLFEKLTGLVLGAPSKAARVTDSWYVKMEHSEKNHYMEFESWYMALERQGYQAIFSQESDLNDWIYLYVPGLYSGKGIFKAKKPENSKTRHHQRIDEIRALGLDARMIDVPNDGSVSSNAALIANTVNTIHRTTGKFIVLIGYSKGGVDSAAALSMFPEIVPYIRCLITLYSPLYGSHIATDIEDSLLRPLVYMGIKNVLECDSTAMADLSFLRREKFLELSPFNENVPSLSLAAAVTTEKSSPFQNLYSYILSKYHKENDGLVACKDAIYPGGEMILVGAMDHVGARPEYLLFRNQTSLILSSILVALNSTKQKWEAVSILHQQDNPDPNSAELSTETAQISNNSNPFVQFLNEKKSESEQD